MVELSCRAYLNKKGKFNIYGILRNKKKLNSYNVKNLKKDQELFSYIGLSNLAKLKIYLKKVKPDNLSACFKCRCIKFFSNPYQVTKNNVLITLIYWKLLDYQKIKCRLVLCSTSEVYGNVEKKFQPITEKIK